QHCNGSGYAGRIGIYEMLEMDNELAALANSDDPGRFIAAAEKRMAGHLLRDSAAQLALAGKTTVSEAMRVTAQLEDWAGARAVFRLHRPQREGRTGTRRAREFRFGRGRRSAPHERRIPDR